MQIPQNPILDYQVLPLAFTKLLNGGTDNECIVEAIFTQGGRTARNGDTYQKLEFKQQHLKEQ